jgi:hypothetical protein
MPDSRLGKPGTPGPWKDSHVLHSIYQRILHFGHQSFNQIEAGCEVGRSLLSTRMSQVVVFTSNSCVVVQCTVQTFNSSGFILQYTMFLLNWNVKRKSFYSYNFRKIEYFFVGN